jgi:release factor glutamine methyltransferase
MTIKESLYWATQELKESCQRPMFEAQLLLSHHLNKDRIYLHTFDNKKVDNISGFKNLVKRRANHEPYEYIVNRVSFYDIELNIEKGVLIPRPETEILIDLVSDIIKREKITSIAEIGIGSGAISIILSRKFPNLNIIATDIADIPIKIAKKNIKKFGLENKIKVIKSNLLDKINRDNIELVVTNPPYISNNFKLPKNIIEYEPKEALFGGEAGDEIVKEIILETKKRGIKYLACEMGYDQKEPIEKFFNQIGIKNFSFYKDLNNLNRGFLIKF